jgi:hypothetical protein
LSTPKPPDLQALGRLLEERRIAAGLRPGELARRAKLNLDSAIGGSEVRALELYGKGELTTIVKLLNVLAIDDCAVLAASGLDLPAMRVRWDEWAAVSEPITMSVRLLAAVWRGERVPDGLDQAGIIEWAKSHPQWKHCLRCIRWSRTHCTYLRDDGTSYEIYSVFPENCPEPYMTLG